MIRHRRFMPRMAISAVTVAAIILAMCAGYLLRQRRTIHRVPILMYHRIGEAEDSAWCVPVDVFERQIRFLSNAGYTSVRPADLVRNRRWGRPLPQRPIILTFDDGFLDVLTVVEPVLKRYGMRGVSYLITDRIGESAEDRRQFEGTDCLTWPEVRAIHERGILEIGAHSHTHSNLAALADPIEEINASYHVIRKHGRLSPDSFCYPYGQYNERVIRAMRRTRFSTAMACEDRVAEIGPESNLLALPRVSVMGGRHRFSVERLREEESEGQMVWRIRYEGLGLEVTPRLRWEYGDTWMERRLFSDGAEKVLRVSVPASAATDVEAELEIWDRHRLFPQHWEPSLRPSGTRSRADN